MYLHQNDVKRYPQKVPSGYFIADTFLCLDSLKNGNLLPADTPDAKVLAALEAAPLIKRLLGSVRHLKRKASGSSCEEIEQLKALLCKRPKNVVGDDWDEETMAMILEYCEAVSADAVEAFMEVT